MARNSRPPDFVGKTIVAIDTRACNVWRSSFSDGSRISIEAEGLNTEGGGSIPVMQVFTKCATTRETTAS